MKNFILILILIATLTLGGWLFYKFYNIPLSPTPNTGLVTRPPEDDIIRITSPQPNSLIANPLQVQGEARGTWYFEASFPIKIIDDTGYQLGAGIATAQSDWMTQNFVPFTANIKFTVPTSTTRGTLILQKDNPSGLPKNADERRIPVIFRSSVTSSPAVQLYY